MVVVWGEFSDMVGFTMSAVFIVWHVAQRRKPAIA
jgi:hypothetical protein